VGVELNAEGVGVTDDRFDSLTKLVSKTTSRRGLLKGTAAAALGGIAMRLRGNGADARARINMACARLGQPCSTIKGTPGSKICCPHLACDSDHTCCTPSNGSCMGDSDCCGSDICRPNPTGLGNRCLPPGAVGAECIEDADCMGGLACEVTTSQCGEICGQDVCRADQTCDPYTLICVGAAGAPCESDAECVSGFCDVYTAICVDIDPVIGSCLFADCSLDGFPVCGADSAGNNGNCVCATTFEGACACVADACGPNDPSNFCTADSDCGTGYVCDVTCFPNYLPTNGLCIKACGFESI
jgi:hypothetical protein